MKQQPESRGERWVVMQLILLGALLFAPSVAPERWSAAAADLARPLGLGIGALGILIALTLWRWHTQGAESAATPELPKADDPYRAAIERELDERF